MSKMSGVLTVIFRDDTPMIFAGDTPSYRTVQIQLTPKQKQQLAPRYCGSNGVNRIYEDISRCILEPVDEQKDGV